MNRKYWLLLSAAVVPVAAAPSVACSSKFSSCEASRSCAGGRAGGHGDAGDPNADADAGAAGVDGGRSNPGGHAGGYPGSDAEGHAGSDAEGLAGSDADAGGHPGSDAGSGGSDAGAAGSVGSACRQDSDCSNHLACDGVESCSSGKCIAGASPCANAEPDRCDVVCTELDGSASCSLRGRDLDKDGHFSNACVTKPGDDCDDSAATVFAGAPELCDGIDNDCDKTIDEGLSLGGNTVEIGPPGTKRSSPAIAWAPDKSLYGIAFVDVTSSSAADVYFELVDKTGAVKLAPSAFNDATSKATSSGGVGLTWGSDRFGAAWTSNNGTFLRTIESNAALGTTVLLSLPSAARYSPVLARLPGADWLSVYYHEVDGDTDIPRLAEAATASGLGIPTNTRLALTGDYPTSWSVAAGDTNFAIATSEGAVSSKAAIYSATLSKLTTLNVPGKGPIVGAGHNGFAIAVAGATGADKPQFYVFAANGTATCGPIAFADSTFKPSDIVPTPKGYLVASSGAIRVQEIAADCTIGGLFATAQVNASGVKLAAGASGYGMVWQDETGNLPRRRLFGPNFCD